MKISVSVDAHIHLQDGHGIEDITAAGVNAVRDAGPRERTGLGLKMMRNQERLPLIITSGCALFKKGYYGSHFGVAVKTKDEIRTEISKLEFAGADIIQMMASSMVSLKDPGTIEELG